MFQHPYTRNGDRMATPRLDVRGSSRATNLGQKGRSLHSRPQEPQGGSGILAKPRTA